MFKRSKMVCAVIPAAMGIMLLAGCASTTSSQQADASAVEAKTESKMETKTAESAKITDRRHPDYMRCRKEPIMGSNRKRKICMTNKEWAAHIDEGHQRSEEFIIDSQTGLGSENQQWVSHESNSQSDKANQCGSHSNFFVECQTVSEEAGPENRNVEVAAANNVSESNKTEGRTHPKITDKDDPNYMKCRHEPLIGTKRTRKICMTNEKWAKHIREGNKRANEFVADHQVGMQGH